MAAPPPPRPPPALMDDIVEEILLRLPPDDPANLARAALVCQRWCRLVTDPGFRRRLRHLHRSPPLLGHLVGLLGGFLFLPTSSSSFRPPDAVCLDWCPLDARHGRILFYHDQDPICTTDPVTKRQLIVWTPAAGEVRMLPMLHLPSSCSHHWNAAVLCAAPGCDHMACSYSSSSSSAVGHGHFTVVLVAGEMFGRFADAYVYSSEADDGWSHTASIQEHGGVKQFCSCNALVGNALYFFLGNNQGILEYDLARKQLSFIRLPPICDWYETAAVLLSVDDEDGGSGLGFALVQDFCLCIWSRESDPTITSGWTWTKFASIDLSHYPGVSELSSSPNIIALADSDGVIVVTAGYDGFLSIDLKSGRVRNVLDDNMRYIAIVDIIPYISFCTPALRATSIVEGPSTGGSNNA